MINATPDRQNREQPARQPANTNSAGTQTPEPDQSREALLKTIAELRRSNAELHMLSMEIQSTNVGLQEANEALEISNEELQTLNEQLILVNGELQIDLIELRAQKSDSTT